MGARVHSNWPLTRVLVVVVFLLLAFGVAPAMAEVTTESFRYPV